MASLNPYLIFPGTCLEAFEYYKTVFGGEFGMIMRFGDVPSDAPAEATSEAHKIMHVSLPIGGGTVLMGSDAADRFGTLKIGDNFSISVSTDGEEEADRIFQGLAQGGKVEMPMSNTFWGSYFGMVHDRFGTGWMVTYDRPRS